MFNFRWGVIFGGTAFLVAFVLSLLFGSVFLLTAAFRALIFGVLFFALGTGSWVLINDFIPELLLPDAREDTVSVFSSETSGSRVNIVLEDTSGAALPSTSGGLSGIDEVENISDLISGKIKLAAAAPLVPKDMDQIQPSDYTGSGEKSVFGDADTGGETGSEGLPPFSTGSAEGGTFGGAFEDLGVFGTASTSDGSDAGDVFGAGGTLGADSSSEPAKAELPERKVSGNKAQTMEGDFNPKEIALGLRTVLEKDKNG